MTMRRGVLARTLGWIVLAGGCWFLALPPCPAADDALFAKFADPPAEAKPFVRWWWNGDCVSEAEIVREIQQMHAAGIGGFEINPIALPPDPNGVGVNGLEWLSPEWNRMVRVAAEAAHKRGMICDLIVGSGWPFGGEFLKPGEMTQRLYVNSFPVKGSTRFSRELATLIEPPHTEKGREWPDAPKPRFLFARLSPKKVSDIGQTKDLTTAAGDGNLAFDVPPGEHTLYVGAVQEGFCSVALGAPGAKGPVLDHYNKAAVLAYLERMSRALGPALGGKLGPAVRAVFCDSIELAAANWTSDFAGQFQSRRGYDVTPYLPFVVDFTRPIPGEDTFADTLRRVRYDLCCTLVELFHERFTRTYHQWCHDNGTVSRFQAYGTPWLLGMLEGYMIPDIPESNNWLFSNPDKHGFLVWTKYTSSGGHLAGRPIISTEAMTNTRGVYQATLDQIKAADDFNFLMGINHSVLHGFNYSPPEAGFPGWVRFGAYFSPRNSWWPYFKHWTSYNARLSSLMQATRPVVQVAILGPEADIWSKDGLMRGPFHGDPWYVHQLWKTISNCGASADYLNERTVQSATFEGGKFRHGPMAYDAVIVASAKSLLPATAQSLLKYAQAGGRIVFVDQTPERSPSFANAAASDEVVRRAVKSAMEKHSARVTRCDAPATKDELLAWTETLFAQLGVAKSVQFAKPDARVFQIHQRDASREVFFLANTDAANPVALEATFNAAGKQAWHWDPETGQREPYSASDGRKCAIVLQPNESLALVFDATVPTTPAGGKVRDDVSRGVALGGPWGCEFRSAQGKPFVRESLSLLDLGKSNDAELARFAGTAVYRKQFPVENPAGASFLDLGEVHDISEVTLNGRALGTRWYGRHVYDIREAVKKGANRLEVKVTTVLYNYTRSMSGPQSEKGWLMNTAHKEPVPAGLVGPVMLRPSAGANETR